MIDVDAKMTKTSDGVWAPYEDSQFLIAHMSSLSFQRKLTRLQQPYRGKIDKGSIDPKISRDLTCEAMAGTILLDWKDVVNSKKEPVAFDEDLAKRVLINQPDVREFISNFAVNLDNFREEDTKALGN
jgi:hypothetical protein